MTIRDAIGQTILTLAHEDERIVVLTADLSQSLRVNQFRQTYPKRFFDVGVAEQNMAGIAAGLALSGKIPFLMSFAVFNPGLNLSMLRTIAYSNLNVKIIGGHSGLSNTGDGATHQALEDIAIMRTLANMTVLSPADEIDAKYMIQQAIKIDGPVYIRSTRLETPILKHQQIFDLGKLEQIYPFKKLDRTTSADPKLTPVILIATGVMNHTAVEAAAKLQEQALTVQVFNASSIKPIDRTKIKQIFLSSRLVVTLEDHQVAAGLGGLIAEIASEIGQPHAPLLRIGVENRFGQSARTPEELYATYGLDANTIITKILDQIE